MSTVYLASLGGAAQIACCSVAATRAVAALGHRDQLLQDLDLGLALLRIADQDLDQLLERQQPVRQLHVALADHLTPFAEGSGVLVVRIEQHNVRGRILAAELNAE